LNYEICIIDLNLFDIRITHTHTHTYTFIYIYIYLRYRKKYPKYIDNVYKNSIYHDILININLKHSFKSFLKYRKYYIFIIRLIFLFAACDVWRKNSLVKSVSYFCRRCCLRSFSCMLITFFLQNNELENFESYLMNILNSITFHQFF